jgi:hypothetical protein
MLLTARSARNGLCIVHLMLAALAAVPACAADSDYVAALLERSHTLDLAGDRYWLSLVHYKPVLGGGYESQADDARFFNHPRGKFEPRLELDATLRAFFEPGGGDQHPLCRFPARFHWLNQRLQIDPQRLPAVICEEYRTWETTLNTHRVTLVFPAAYLNGPSSMFGHTLLRLDPGDSRKDVPLAAYALNLPPTPTRRTMAFSTPTRASSAVTRAFSRLFRITRKSTNTANSRTAISGNTV